METTRVKQRLTCFQYSPVFVVVRMFLILSARTDPVKGLSRGAVKGVWKVKYCVDR